MSHCSYTVLLKLSGVQVTNFCDISLTKEHKRFGTNFDQKNLREKIRKSYLHNNTLFHLFCQFEFREFQLF